MLFEPVKWKTELMVTRRGTGLSAEREMCQSYEWHSRLDLNGPFFSAVTMVLYATRDSAVTKNM